MICHDGERKVCAKQQALPTVPVSVSNWALWAETRKHLQSFFRVGICRADSTNRDQNTCHESTLDEVRSNLERLILQLTTSRKSEYCRRYWEI